MEGTEEQVLLVARILRERIEEHQQALIDSIADLATFTEAVRLVKECFERGGKLVLCGNGGSAAVASHVVDLLTSQFMGMQPIPAVCLNESFATITGLGSDYGYEYSFSRQAEAIARPGDLLVLLSTSGNSPNILNAVSVARSKGMSVIGLTNNAGGKLGEIADVWLAAHSPDSTCSENVHLSLLLTLGECVRDLVRDDNGSSGTGRESVYVARVLEERLRHIAQTLGNCMDELPAFTQATMMVRRCFDTGGKLLVCGNGASAAIGAHLATMCMGRPYGDQPMPVVVLAATMAPVTALANDYGFEYIFSRQVQAFGKPEDVFIGFSINGESPNVLLAAEACRTRGMPTVGLTNSRGGSLGELADIWLSASTTDPNCCQVVHKVVVLTLAQCVRALLS